MRDPIREADALLPAAQRHVERLQAAGARPAVIERLQGAIYSLVQTVSQARGRELAKAIKGDTVIGHKYRSRKWDAANTRWLYDYGDGHVPAQHQEQLNDADLNSMAGHGIRNAHRMTGDQEHRKYVNQYGDWRRGYNDMPPNPADFGMTADQAVEHADRTDEAIDASIKEHYASGKTSPATGGDATGLPGKRIEQDGLDLDAKPDASHDRAAAQPSLPDPTRQELIDKLIQLNPSLDRAELATMDETPLRQAVEHFTQKPPRKPEPEAIKEATESLTAYMSMLPDKQKAYAVAYTKMRRGDEGAGMIASHGTVSDRDETDIRREIDKRIDAANGRLHAQQTPATAATGAAPQYKVEHQGEWTYVSFPSKPAASVLDALRGAGARWHGKRKAWYFTRHVSDADLATKLGGSSAGTGDSGDTGDKQGDTAVPPARRYQTRANITGIDMDAIQALPDDELDRQIAQATKGSHNDRQALEAEKMRRARGPLPDWQPTVRGPEPAQTTPDDQYDAAAQAAGFQDLNVAKMAAYRYKQLNERYGKLIALAKKGFDPEKYINSYGSSGHYAANIDPEPSSYGDEGGQSSRFSSKTRAIASQWLDLERSLAHYAKTLPEIRAQFQKLPRDVAYQISDGELEGSDNPALNDPAAVKSEADKRAASTQRRNEERANSINVLDLLRQKHSESEAQRQDRVKADKPKLEFGKPDAAVSGPEADFIAKMQSPNKKAYAVAFAKFVRTGEKEPDFRDYPGVTNTMSEDVQRRLGEVIPAHEQKTRNRSTAQGQWTQRLDNAAKPQETPSGPSLYDAPQEQEKPQEKPGTAGSVLFQAKSRKGEDTPAQSDAKPTRDQPAKQADNDRSDDDLNEEWHNKMADAGIYNGGDEHPEVTRRNKEKQPTQQPAKQAEQPAQQPAKQNDEPAEPVKAKRQLTHDDLIHGGRSGNADTENKRKAPLLHQDDEAPAQPAKQTEQPGKQPGKQEDQPAAKPADDDDAPYKAAGFQDKAHARSIMEQSREHSVKHAALKARAEKEKPEKRVFKKTGMFAGWHVDDFETGHRIPGTGYPTNAHAASAAGRNKDKVLEHHSDVAANFEDQLAKLPRAERQKLIADIEAEGKDQPTAQAQPEGKDQPTAQAQPEGKKKPAFGDVIPDKKKPAKKKNKAAVRTVIDNGQRGLFDDPEDDKGPAQHGFAFSRADSPALALLRQARGQDLTKSRIDLLQDLYYAEADARALSGKAGRAAERLAEQARRQLARLQ